MSLSNKRIYKGLESSEEVISFIDAAELYCKFIENSQSSNALDFLIALQKHLLVLYQAGVKLPRIDLQEDMDFSEDIDNSSFGIIVNSIMDRLSDNRYYVHLFDPTDKTDDEVIYGDLLDDMSDIYKDIKRAFLILKIDSRVAQANAIWQFKFDFDNHWGDHCINAIYATHYFLKRIKG